MSALASTTANCSRSSAPTAPATSIINCISGRYRPTEGHLFYRGQDITALNPNARPSLGIGRTFQNPALFQHMSVLDNIMVGRGHLLKNKFITGSLYWLTGAQHEKLEHRRKVDQIIAFLDLQSVRKATAGTLPYGLRKRVELARAMALEPSGDCEQDSANIEWGVANSEAFGYCRLYSPLAIRIRHYLPPGMTTP